MSRIGNRPLTIPAGVTVNIAADNTVTVNGNRGSVVQQFSSLIMISQKNQILTTTRSNNLKSTKMLHGTTNSLLKNMIKGVTSGFLIELNISGVGYRARVKGQNLELDLGFSHPVTYQPRQGVVINVPRPTVIEVRGVNKEHVGAAAAVIRSFRPPEPYKGKGIKYKNEFIMRKEGKAAGK